MKKISRLIILFCTCTLLSCSDGVDLTQSIDSENYSELEAENTQNALSKSSQSSDEWHGGATNYSTTHAPLIIDYSVGTDYLYTGYRTVGSYWREVVQTNGNILAEEPGYPYIYSNRPPSMVESHMVYKPTDANRIRYGVVNFSNYNISTVQLPNARTKTGPVITRYRGDLYVFFKGENNNSIYQMKSTDDGQTWSSTMAISGTNTNTIPSVTVFNNRLYLFYKGPTSTWIYYRYMNSTGTWSSEYMLPTSESRTPHTPTVRTNPYENRLYLVFRGEDNGIYYRSMNTYHSWSPQQRANITNANKETRTSNAPDISFTSNMKLIVFREYETSLIHGMYTYY